MTPEQEKKNKRVGMAVSFTVHTVILLIFAFLMAWRAPDPPLPEYGIEINFGTSDEGSGDVQPLTPVSAEENQEDPAPQDIPETREEVIPEETIPEQEVVESEENVTETFEDESSKDVVKEEVKDEKVPEEKVEKEIETAKEEVIEEVEKTTDKPDKTTETGAEGKEGETKDPQNANQGDKKDKQGDQGSEKGDIDARSLYGNPGGGGGTALEMAGWIWDSKPAPDDTSSEEGRIVFEIKIDDQGEIISIKTIEKTVNPTVERIYKAEVEKLTFSKTDNLPPAPTSTGRITFIIKAK